MKWKVQLIGDVFDLKEVSKALTNNDFSISEREGCFILESSKFDELEHSNEVVFYAEAILTILTGAIRLSLGGRTQVRIANVTKIREDGGNEIFINISDAISVNAIASAEVIQPNGTIKLIHPAHNIPIYLKLAFKDQNVAKAMRLLGSLERNWSDLYRLYEVIEGDVGGQSRIVGNEWATKASIRLLKHTANSPSAVDDASRHGSESTVPPIDPMEIGEARALVETILHRWLYSKATLPHLID